MEKCKTKINILICLFVINEQQNGRQSTVKSETFEKLQKLQ